MKYSTMDSEISHATKREVVSVHVGQAGVQMGALCWQLYCLEHNIDEQGQHRPPTQPTSSDYEDDDQSFRTFFSERAHERFRARAVYVDTAPSAVDAVRSSSHHRLYDSNQLLSGMEDAANNFASGYYSVGRRLLPDALEEIRKQVEEADSLQGFIMFHSYGGGTGSGFTSLLTEHMAIEYPKLVDMRFAVMPSSKVSSAVVEPYNSILTAHNSLQHSDVTFVINNTAMYELVFRRLGIDRPTFRHINSVISQTVSSVTGSLRFQGALNMNLSELCTNLVPFPRLHFLHTNYAPLMPKEHVPYNTFSTLEITEMCFQSSALSQQPLIRDFPNKYTPLGAIAPRDSATSKSTLGESSPKPAVYMACSLMYRGQVNPGDVTTAIKKVISRRAVRFVSWTPTGFKVGINYQPVVTLPGLGLSNVPRSVCQLSNTTTAGTDWDSIAHKFDTMFEKRAFVFWYIREGMEESEIEEARENVAALQKDYQEISEMVPPQQERSREVPMMR